MKRENHLRELAVCGATPKMGNREMAYLAHGLSGNSNLRLLDLTGASFNAPGLARLKPFFEKNPSLKVLSLGENANIGDDGLQVILSALRCSKGELRVLNMEGCGIGNLGAAAISSYMGSGGSHLRVLELSHNSSMGDAGVEKLAERIKVDSCKIETLGLKHVGMGDRGLLHLAESLDTNRTLQTLNLQGNCSITDVSASRLLKSVYNTDSLSALVESNHTLKNIDLRGCSISKGLLYMVDLVSSQSVRFKVSKYFESFGCVSALGSLDHLLLPNVLAFVGEKNGLDVLFRTVRTIPSLFTRSSAEESTKKVDTSHPFTLQQTVSSRKQRLHDLIMNTVPKLRCMIRCMDGRNRSKHEFCVTNTINNYFSSVLPSKFVEPLKAMKRRPKEFYMLSLNQLTV